MQKFARELTVKINWSILFWILLLPSVSTAQIVQTDCERRLEIARDLYDAGQLSAVIDTLRVCFSEKEASRKDILSLAATAYRFLDHSDSARQQLLLLYRLNPFYQLDSDIPEIDYLDNQIIVYPKYRYYFKGGVYLFTRPIGPYSNTSIVDVLSESFGLDGGDPLGMRGEFSFSWSLGQQGPYLNTGIGFSRYNFRYRSEFDNIQNPDGNVDRVKVSFREKQWWLHVPISVTKYFGVEKSEIRNRFFLPYGQIGLSVDFLQKSSAEFLSPTLSYENFNGGETTLLSDIAIGDLRKAMNLSVFGVIGAKAKSGVNSYFVELSIGQTLFNHSKKDLSSPLNQSLKDQVFYENSSYRLSNLSLSIGYNRFLFRAVEKK